MKKYKLIKEYPTSPELNTIFNYWTDNISEQVHNIIYGFIPLKTIKQYPEFWQEIIEKDYEILSFKGIFSSNDGLFTLKDGKYYYETWIDNSRNGLSLIDMKIDIVVKIHSVKRLSDGEIFTIGDKINVTYSTNSTIQKFILKNNKIIVQIAHDCVYYLNDCSKTKQPLFKTEDGVDVFDGDEYYSMYLMKNFKIQLLKATDTHSKADGISVLDFSTKKAAENWIKCHKPVLTLNEVLDIIKNEDDTDSMKTKLTKLIKEKLHKS